MKTFIDSGVLISAWRGDAPERLRALTILNDLRRQFVLSPFVELEVMPKAVWHKNANETAFYQSIFDRAQWIADYHPMVIEARRLANLYGLGGMDALHIAAAILAQADEFVTAERPTSPLLRVTDVKIVTIRR